jgi:hypothetical protein
MNRWGLRGGESDSRGFAPIGRLAVAHLIAITHSKREAMLPFARIIRERGSGIMRAHCVGSIQ